MLGYSADILYVEDAGWRPFKCSSYFQKQCCGSGMFIPDPTFFHPGSRIPDPNFSIPDPGSRIRIKEFQSFNPKKWFLSSRKYDPGCSSRIPDPDPYFLPIPDPGSRGQKGTGSLIPDPDPQHCSKGDARLT
jgi:hypothetical protein